MSVRVLLRLMSLVRMRVGLWRRPAHGRLTRGAPDICSGMFIEGGAGAGIGALGEWEDGGGAARLFAVEVALCGKGFVD